ncbi:MAG: hypothetical protein GF353_00595 [Candidatus Lokiarchaeota archaeon]|nr:hypothetical protein [Candidatus Lokiarchaeota archaeon]
MLEILKNQVTIGDNLLIILVNGQEIEGRVNEFGDNYVVLIAENKKKTLFEKLIGGWEIINKEEAPKHSSEVTSELNSDKDDTIFVSDLTVKNEVKNNKIKTSNNANQPKKQKKKFTKSFGSFEELREEIIKPIVEEQDQKLVPANGLIIKFIKGGNFGFVRNEKGDELYFNLNDVIDEDLLFRINNNEKNITVLFTLSSNYKGPIARYLHKPKSISELIEDSKKYENLEKYDVVSAILKQILNAYPDNISAKDYLDKIKKLTRQKFKGKSKEFFPNYQKAKFAKEAKNYEQAMKYFKNAIQSEEKLESSIKDLASLYIEMGENEQGLNFINNYADKLPQNITSFNFLENYYYSLKEYIKTIEYLDFLLKNTDRKNKRRYTYLLAKKSSCYIRLKEIDSAKKILEDILKIQADHSYALKLLQILDEASKSGDYEEIEKVIDETELSTFGGGLSKLIQDTIDNYEEYYGVPPKIAESKKFTKSTLREIRRISEEAGRARPRERANYLLTESKLMLELEPEKDIQHRRVLARYCNAMALYLLSEKSHMDSVRHYYLEAFSLEDKWDSLTNQVSIFLNSFKMDHTKLTDSIRNPTNIEDALYRILGDDLRQNNWNGLLSAFIWNRKIFAQLLKRIYERDTIRKNAIEYLKKQQFSLNENTDFSTFGRIWEDAREKRKREYDTWFASTRALGLSENIESLTDKLFESLTSLKKDWLPQLDTYRLNMIKTDIFDILKLYLQQKTFDDKERIVYQAKSQIAQLITEIKNYPTKFSYEGYIPLLEKIEVLLNKSFKKVLESSTPRIMVTLLGETSVVEQNRVVPIQISIKNERECSPITQIKIKIVDDEDVSFVHGECESPESLKGGEERIFKIQIKVSNRVLKDKATDIKVQYEYQIRYQDEPIIKTESLALKLYSEDEFERISNPYAPVADSGPVHDKSMFFGRNEFIKNITNSLLESRSKCAIIYGQKRSGKSSVLFHLKNELIETGKTFCIDFSLGSIIENLNSATFFYKILSEIEDGLDELKDKGESVPLFKMPSFNSIEKNPAIIFDEAIKRFIKAANSNKSWEKKLLIILIDEFTYLYTAILRKSISIDFMKSWKAFIEKGYYATVLVGQDVMPKFKNQFANEFGVTEDKRLTYLSEDDAKRLITEPIWDHKNNESRYIGNAVNTIIDYTSSNPYYIQIFCSRLVDYMNKNKFVKVTKANIDEVANTFIEGGVCLTPDKFDNLLTAGDADVEAIPRQDTYNILRQIANGSRNIGLCPRENIKLGNIKYENRILKDLINREVITIPQEGYYKIQVRLFKEWLLRH